MNMQSSTLKFDETGEPFHIQQATRFVRSRQPGRRLATLVCREFPSAAVSSHCSTTGIVSISDEEVRKRTRSVFLTATHERSSAVATPRSRIF
jgi:hypothetical protein